MTKHTTITTSAIALNFEDSSGAPEWVQLLPAGPAIVGRDGRGWRLASAQAVAAAFDPRKPPQIDIEHSTQIKAPKGEPAPAVGWITQLAVRPVAGAQGVQATDGGELWGRVEWTALGAELIGSKSYRFLSPAFHHTGAGEIKRLVSAGLTNSPNLDLAALNAAQTETPMDITKLLEALGLTAQASVDDAIAAATGLKTSLNSALTQTNAAPDPAQFVPVADYQLALNRLGALEGAETARKETEIARAVDAACAAGKIAPSSRDYHLAACRTEGGLDRFVAMTSAAPVIGGGADLAATPTATNAALSEDELAICKMFGTAPDEFVAAKGK